MLSALPTSAPVEPTEEKAAKQPKRPEVGLIAGGASVCISFLLSVL